MFTFNLLITILIVSVFIIIIKYLLNVRRISRYLRNIPSPPGLLFAGHVLYFKNPTDILNDLTNLARQYNGYFKLHFFGIYTILITDSKKAEKLLGTTKLLHKSQEYNHFRRWLGTGLLTSRPEKWRNTRKIITPTFHFQILEQFIDIYNSANNILINKLSQKANGNKFDVYPYIALCTLDIICETAMGTSVNAQINSKSEYVKSVQEMSRIIRMRLFSPITRFDWFYYLTADYKLEKKALETIHNHTTAVIEKRKKIIEKSSLVADNSTGKSNHKNRLAFLDLLLQCEINGKPLTDMEIREEVDTFMFEGHDTTASAITFTLYCLSRNPTVQEIAVAELKEIFNSNVKASISHTHLLQMKYLEKVIKESLRLYPSVPMFGRQLQEDAEFDGEVIPKGVTISAFAFGIHRDPSSYPDPDKFDPERFSKENQGCRNPFAYVPFSAGPRNCIGQKFAMLEMKTTLSSILRSFEVLPVDDFKPELVPNVILKSLNGVEISLRKRDF